MGTILRTIDILFHVFLTAIYEADANNRPILHIRLLKPREIKDSNLGNLACTLDHPYATASRLFMFPVFQIEN